MGLYHFPCSGQASTLHCLNGSQIQFFSIATVFMKYFTFSAFHTDNGLTAP